MEAPPFVERSMAEEIPYTPPKFQGDGFNCPFCNAFSDQHFGRPPRLVKNVNYGESDDFWICRCMRCASFSVWINKTMVYPRILTAPTSNVDLSDDIKKDYEEARAILSDSPRGAAALLRVAIQKLCKELGQAGTNINDDIAALVKKGLPVPVQRSLDIVRVVGNNAVHPGQIDISDDVDTANKLFGLVNLITDIMISQPKHVENLYQSIVPENQRKAIEERDKKP